MNKPLKDKSFLGTGWDFPPSFVRQGQRLASSMVTEEADIKQSLSILMSTVPGERVMNPTFGCGLRKMVFESITESALTRIKDAIERAILFFEPRITLEKIDIDSDDERQGRIDIHIYYTIRSTNTRSNIVYPFYFREGTLVKD